MWLTEIEFQDHFSFELMDEILLHEIKFDASDELDIQEKNEYFQTEHVQGDRHYRVIFQERDDVKNSFDVTLRHEGKKESISSLQYYIDQITNPESATNSTENNSNPLEIFQFVVSSITSFIKKNDPKALFVIADSKKKSKTYDHISKRISAITGWVLHSTTKKDGTFSGVLVNPKENSTK